MSTHSSQATPPPAGRQYVALYDKYGKLLAIGPQEADAYFRAQKLGVVRKDIFSRDFVGENEHRAWWDGLDATQKAALREQGDVPPLA
jgi:hypothetical protein